MTKFEMPGTPDVIIVYKGKFVGVEIKRPKVGKLSENQKKFRDNLEANGGLYFVVTSVEDAAEVVRQLKRYE